MSDENTSSKIDIIYSDKHIAVCIKPAGIPCESSNKSTATVLDILKAQLAEKGQEYVAMVHRLDQVTEGIMVFSLSPMSTGKLSESIASGATSKQYLAVVHGVPEESRGELHDILFKDSGKNKTFVVKRERKGTRPAALRYDVIGTIDNERFGRLSLLRIDLITGRTHQIRVQFSSRGMPLLGDGKYGAKDNFPFVALLSHKISFPHPKSRKPLEFTFDPPSAFPWDAFN